MRQLTAAPQDPSEDAETVEEASDSAEPHSARRERPRMSSAQSGPAERKRRPRCTRGWPRNAGDAKRPNGSAMTSAGSSTPVAGSKEPTRRPRGSRVGVSPDPLREGLRVAHGGPGGVGC
jgi:hypothetical protein